MPLPTTISGTLMVDDNWYHGPFLSSAGNVYAILTDSADKSLVEAWKATDPAVSFSNVGTNPNLANNVGSLWVYQVGDNLHVAHQEVTTGRVGYSVFNMATDVWDVSNELVETPAQAPSVGGMGVSIGVRSDGDVAILYNGDTDLIMGTPFDRVDYARREGGVWTVGVSVDGDAASENHYYGAVLVVAGSDRMHLFFHRNNLIVGLMAYHLKTLRSDNTLSAGRADFGDVTSPHKHPYAKGAYYTSGGVGKVRVVWGFAGNGGGSVVEYDDADSPAVGASSTPADAAPKITAGSSTGALVVEGRTLYALFPLSSDSDLFLDRNVNGGGWGVDKELLNGVTVNRISPNVFNRGGKKIGYVYDDGGTIKYNEYPLETVGGLALLGAGL